MRELEKLLQQQAPPSMIDNTLYELPPLVIDGIPTPVDKMTQVNLLSMAEDVNVLKRELVLLVLMVLD